MSDDELRWIESGGGPLLVLPSSLLPDWGGTDSPGSGAAATDYDRACDVSEYIGAIAVGEGQGLVLGDMPMPAAWWAESAGMLVRWMAATSEEAVLEVLRDPSLDPAWEREATFACVDGSLVLFDSAYPGTGLPPDVARISLTPGRYAVETAVLEGDDTSLVLHRFVRAK
jgi:hypothetical protein